MRFALFYHSLASDWNHGNAHFLRGVVRQLIELGHEVTVYELRDNWSRWNLERDHGPAASTVYRAAYPELGSILYDMDSLDLDAALGDVDVVLVHEFNMHELVTRIGDHHRRNRHYRLLFHDTHHRGVTAPQEMARYDLTWYDGVLAFGETVRDLYLTHGWTHRAWTWHEAADVTVFRPLPKVATEFDVVWIGNWGDDERTEELHEFLLRPIKRLGLRAKVWGVRYPDHARAALAEAGIAYGGYLPNHRVPEIFAAAKVTIHVPRRAYTQALAGVPTIRPFEAMACGIPLLCSPWTDSEGLFTLGDDYLMVRDGHEMTSALKHVLHDPVLARELAMCARQTILARHTCHHRAVQLLNILASLEAEPTDPGAKLTPVTRSASAGGIDQGALALP